MDPSEPRVVCAVCQSKESRISRIPLDGKLAGKDAVICWCLRCNRMIYARSENALAVKVKVAS